MLSVSMPEEQQRYAVLHQHVRQQPTNPPGRPRAGCSGLPEGQLLLLGNDSNYCTPNSP